MKDFKYITTHQRNVPVNSRKQAAIPPLDPELSKPGKKRVRLLLPVLAILLVGYPLFSIIFATQPAVSSVKSVDPSYGQLDCSQSFNLGVAALSNCRLENGTFKALLPEGATAHYSIDEELQATVYRMMEAYQVPFGVFVAVEPKTGRILSMASFSSIDPQWPGRAFYDLFPMASLFKIVTASAALEQKQVTADTVFAYRGKLTSENPRYWETAPYRRNPEMTLSLAMGKSVNPVFGRLAGDVVGGDVMMATASRFGFNEPLLPGSIIPPSKAQPPATRRDLMLMGAGLGREVKASPLHVAAIMAGIANRGVMLAPSLLTEIRGADGQVIYSQKPTLVRQMLSPETVLQLEKMLLTTVSSGTSRRAFHDRRGRLKLSSVNVAAKTGSIDGYSPPGHYSWFAAYAPVEDPKIALVALVINQNKWRIKAAQLGEKALETYFR